VIVLFLLTITCLVGWVATWNKLSKTEQLLEAAYKNTYSSPIKELTANFRDFVQSIDGHVSPEVDAAIKKLEEEVKPLALPAPQILDTKNTKTGKRRIMLSMDTKTWNLFVQDLKASQYSDEKMSVIKRWGKKFIFPLEDQIDLIKLVHYDDDRRGLRDYFDKFHSEG